jgi:16S rRNA (guanine527-N7)-methyltransferase
MTHSEAVESKLEAYASLVTQWAPRVDLISPGDVPRFRERHIDDCLRLLPLGDEVGAGPSVDVGSGAGLPGIVMAVARPIRLWRLLEPRSKKVAFLELVVRELDLANVDIYPVTAQQAADDPTLREAHVLAVSRALAPPARSLAWLRPLVAPRGLAAVFVGKTAQTPSGTQEWGEGLIVEPRGRKGIDGNL